MSLINDALKRASRSDKAQAPRVDSGTYGSMFPVQEKRKPKFPWAIVVVVVLALGLSAVFFAKWWGASRAVAVAQSPAAQPKQKPAPAPAPAPEVVKESAPKPAPIESKPIETAVVPAPVVAANPAPEPEPPVVPAAVAWPAELKLNGIFYSKTTPHALISGKTVAVGDEINGIHIVKIEPTTVTIEWKGQTKTLYTD